MTAGNSSGAAEHEGDLLVRRVNLEFDDAPTELEWFADSLFYSVSLNALSLFFPLLEPVMIKEMRIHRERLAPVLGASTVRDFISQESNHSAVHLRSFDAVEAQGFRIYRTSVHLDWMADTFVPFLVEVMGRPVLGHGSPMSTFAGTEHVTFRLSERFLALLLDDLEAKGSNEEIHELSLLYLWHCIEEIEHRSVVFDADVVLNKSWLKRKWGFIASTAMLSYLYLVPLVALSRQLPRLLGRAEWRRRGGWRGYVRTSRKEFAELGFREHFRTYFRKGFHPSDEDVDDLMERACALLDEVSILRDERSTAVAG